jgi:predicted flap endonuclease-1-like 5' DNA nuclease
LRVEIVIVAMQHECRIATWRRAVTFFSPDFDGRSATVWPFAPYADAVWGSWLKQPSAAQAMLEQASAAQLELFQTSLRLMLLPFSVLADDTPGDAPVAAPAAAQDIRPAVEPETELPPAVEAAASEPAPVAAASSPAPVANAPEATPAGQQPMPFAAPTVDGGADDVEGVAPTLLSAPNGGADDLLLIKGIGPKLKQLLNSLGVWHFSQIVGWTPAEVAWINAKIDFRGRVQREGWQAQAAELLKPAKAA